MGLIAFSIGDNLKTTRHQLTKLYEVSFDKCEISKVETMPYPSRGTYKIFYTDCTNDFYPFLLDRNKKETDYSIFKVGTIISKEINSVNIDIWDNERQYTLKMRHPEDEDDRAFGAGVFLTFILIVVAIIIIIPNSLFDKFVTKR